MGRALRGSDNGYWGVPCSPTSGKSPCWVPVAWAGGCSVQGPLGTCAPHAGSVRVPTRCHGVSTSLLTRCMCLRSCMCAPRCVSSCACHACAPMRTHACTGACVQCAGMLAGLPASAGGRAHAQGQGRAHVCWHTGFAAPGSRCAQHHSQSWHARMASCQRLCSVPAGHREGVGSQLAEFVLIITQVVTKSGMS